MWLNTFSAVHAFRVFFVLDAASIRIEGCSGGEWHSRF